MNVSDLLNPLTTTTTTPINRRSRCVSSPINYYNQSNRHYFQQQQRIPEQQQQEEDINHHLIGKPRSRFSEYEDNIIRNGVAQRLTWGQISDLLPHRKRATCFNRYRTLQGIRKSRKQSESPPMMSTSISSPSLSPVTSHFHTPTTPPPTNRDEVLYPILKQEEHHQDISLPPLYYKQQDRHSFNNNNYLL